jgi:hypothetical protein
MDITHDPTTWPYGDRLWAFCQAVARQEGADEEGSAPDRYNNPGDLSRGDEHGSPVTGYHILPDRENLIIFASKQGGWNALRMKFWNILNGRSHVFSPEMTLEQIGAKYATNPDWASGVARLFGVDPKQPFSSYFSEDNPQ